MKSFAIFGMMLLSSGCVLLHKPLNGDDTNNGDDDSNNSDNPSQSNDTDASQHTNDAGQPPTKDASINYGPWSSCFDPSETYPTGVLKYPNCATYCQSLNQTPVPICSGPDPSSNSVLLTSDSVLIWCGYNSGVCGNISQYPDYIQPCDDGPWTTVCVEGYNFGSYTEDFSGFLPCNEFNHNSTATVISAQCCCQ